MAYQPRREAEFFTHPAHPGQRRYEALRAYFVDGRPAAEVAAGLGYSTAAVESLVRNFRAGDREFFTERRRGPKVAPAKEAARARIVELRRAGHSIDEIAVALRVEGTPLNRTGISEVIAEEGFERLWRRPEPARGAPRRETLPRATVIDFETWPQRCDTKLAGLLLAVPELVALDLPAIVAAAGYPGTRQIPAVSSVLSLLALKLVGVRRVSHVDDLAADPAARILAFTAHKGDTEIYRALQAGVRGYLLKDTLGDQLTNAIRAVAAGRRIIPPDIAARLAEFTPRADLTDREIEVLHLAATGLRNRDIANAIVRSEETVKVHLKHLMAKLGVKDRTEAVTVALRRGIIRLDD